MTAAAVTLLYMLGRWWAGWYCLDSPFLRVRVRVRAEKDDIALGGFTHTRGCVHVRAIKGGAGGCGGHKSCMMLLSFTREPISTL